MGVGKGHVDCKEVGQLISDDCLILTVDRKTRNTDRNTDIILSM